MDRRPHTEGELAGGISQSQAAEALSAATSQGDGDFADRLDALATKLSETTERAADCQAEQAQSENVDLKRADGGEETKGGEEAR